jgi:hypothetical protein
MTASPRVAVSPVTSPGGERLHELMRALRDRRGRLRIVAWILILLLPALIVSVLGSR